MIATVTERTSAGRASHLVSGGHEFAIVADDGVYVAADCVLTPGPTGTYAFFGVRQHDASSIETINLVESEDGMTFELPDRSYFATPGGWIQR